MNKRIYVPLSFMLSRVGDIFQKRFPRLDIHIYDRDVTAEEIVADPLAKVVMMDADDKRFGKVRTTGRKDITLVGYCPSSATDGRQAYLDGLSKLKANSANLIAVAYGDGGMIVTPEEAAYHDESYIDRPYALFENLADMAWHRSHLTFTNSTVVSGEPVDWNGPEVPESLRVIVNHCVEANAYKPFKDSTVGHFAHKIDDQTFLTSIRKSNFNKLKETGMVRVKTDGPDTVIAYGAKPSVGGQSQRIVFRDHPGFDSIVHFHCPLRENPVDTIPIVSQREVECGSHQCGKNTSDNLGEFENGEIKAVMLDQHGPNIVFNKNIDPQKVIDFIERNFDLSKKTGGYML